VAAVLMVCTFACGGELESDSTESSSRSATVAASPDLAATAASPSEIDLAWRAASGSASGWQVYRSAGSSGVFELLATLPTAARTYGSGGLSASTVYCYKVRSFRTSGSTSYSSFLGPACATTPAPPPPPPAIAAPSSTSVVPIRVDYSAPAVSGVHIAWTDNSSNEDGFRIECAPSAAGPWTLVAIAPADATSAFQYVAREEQVCVRVTAFDSNTVSTPSSTICTTPPANPTNLIAVASPAGIDLAWSDNSAAEDGYRVSRSESPGVWTDIATLPANATTYSDRSIATDTTYAYRVQALKGGGASDYSNQAFGVLPTAPPAAPTGLVAMYWADMEGFGWLYFDVSWTGGSTNEAGFRLEFFADGVSGWMPLATLQPDTADYFQKYDLLLLIGATFGECYRVVAFNALGDSAPSNVFCTGWGGAPTDLVATAVDPNTVELSWTNTAVFASSYLILRAPGFEGPWESVSCATDHSSTTCRDTGLVAGQHYLYSITAMYPQNWHYDFYNSSWVEVSTPP
jgi:hypothetical protein